MSPSVENDGVASPCTDHDDDVPCPIKGDTAASTNKEDATRDPGAKSDATHVAQDGDELKQRKAMKAGEVKSCKKETKYLRVVENDEQVHDSRLNLDSLRKSLPAAVFVKSLRRSLQWMVWDIAVWSCLLYAIKIVYHNHDQFHSGWIGNIAMLSPTAKTIFSAILKWTLMLVLYILAGFFMWCTFVVGHDCGHGTFSNNPHVNFICGLINHGAILVPFTPWARSHRFHHYYHNHVEKDYSFPWSHDPSYDKPLVGFWKIFGDVLESCRWMTSILYPFTGYFWYLVVPMKFGGIDGSHYFPGLIPGDRLWEKIDKPELLRSWISVGVCFAYIYFYITCVYDNSVADFMVLYLPPWVFFCYFLFTVTFLQHHSESVKVYDDTTWKFTTANFETIDRTYGKIVDLMHHHISDCHVVHHLFFTKIPHYNLDLATKAMVKWMKENGVEDLYQYVDTRDFYTRVFKYMYKFASRAKLVTKKDM